MRETVGGPENAVLVAPGDAGALAAAIRADADADANACAGRAVSARRRFDECYTLDAVARRMSSFHAAALTSRR